MCDLTVECGLHVGKGEAGESAVRLTRVRGLCVLGVAAEGLVSVVWMTEEEGGGSISTGIG